MMILILSRRFLAEMWMRTRCFYGEFTLPAKALSRIGFSAAAFFPRATDRSSTSLEFFFFAIASRENQNKGKA